MNPFAVCAFAVVAVALISVIRRLEPSFGAVAAAVAGILIFVFVADKLVPFVEFINKAASESGAESYFTLMLKALAISLCCRMSAEICRDCGEASLASRVELAGKVGIVLISLPVIQQLFDISKDMLG